MKKTSTIDERKGNTCALVSYLAFLFNLNFDLMLTSRIFISVFLKQLEIVQMTAADKINGSWKTMLLVVFFLESEMYSLDTNIDVGKLS